MINKGEVKRLDAGICRAGNGQVTYMVPDFVEQEATAIAVITCLFFAGVLHPGGPVEVL